MTYDEYVALKSPVQAVTPGVHASEVVGEDRTLVYGYTVERDTFHAYKKDGELHVVLYDGLHARYITHWSGVELDPYLFAPNKRAYPERCDFEFCCLLQSRGVDVCFTTYDTTFEDRFPDAYQAAFKGFTMEQLGDE